jgi:hypothetical protein
MWIEIFIFLKTKKSNEIKITAPLETNESRYEIKNLNQ